MEFPSLLDRLRVRYRVEHARKSSILTSNHVVINFYYINAIALYWTRTVDFIKEQNRFPSWGKESSKTRRTKEVSWW